LHVLGIVWQKFPTTDIHHLEDLFSPDPGRRWALGTATRYWSSILLPVYRMLTSTQGPSRMLIVRKGTHHRLNWDILDDKSTYPDLSALPGHIQLFAQFIGTKG